MSTDLKGVTAPPTTSESGTAPIAQATGTDGKAVRSSLRLRLLHRLLTPGWIRPTPAARLRGWARVVTWLDAAPPQRRELVKRALRFPLLSWQEAGGEIERFGESVARAYGVPPGAQRRQLWWMYMRHGIVGPTYVEYQLYRPERRRIATEFVQELEHTRLLRWIHRRHGDEDARIFRDKPRFAEWCRINGLPAVDSILEFDEGRVVESRIGGDPETSLPPVDLFSKPNDATAGLGTERWVFVGGEGDDRRWRATDGRIVDAAGLLGELATLSLTLPLKEGRTSRRMLLQRGLSNHRELRDLTQGALCTARIVVARPPVGRARIIGAAYRMATGNAAADNYAVGGIVAPIDLASGRLMRAIRRLDKVLSPIDHHPDTGAAIEGRVLPGWADAVALAERGLDLAPRLPTLGWDVAFTDDGPVFIEGNIAPNPGILQKPTGSPLSETSLPAVIEAHVRSLLRG